MLMCKKNCMVGGGKRIRTSEFVCFDALGKCFVTNY